MVKNKLNEVQKMVRKCKKCNQPIAYGLNELFNIDKKSLPKLKSVAKQYKEQKQKGFPYTEPYLCDDCYYNKEVQK